MSAKSDLNEELRQKLQRIEELKKDLANWNRDVEEDIKRQRREQERHIEKAQQEYENLRERMAEKEKVYDEKINAINGALHSIEEISKTSPTEKI